MCWLKIKEQSGEKIIRSGKWKKEEDSIDDEVKKKISNHEWTKKEILIRIKEINWEEMGMKEGMEEKKR